MINVGIIGLGLMGEKHVSVYDKMPGVNIVSVCDLNKKKLREISKEYKAESHLRIIKRCYLRNNWMLSVSVCLIINILM